MLSLFSFDSCETLAELLWKLFQQASQVSTEDCVFLCSSSGDIHITGKYFKAIYWRCGVNQAAD